MGNRWDEDTKLPDIQKIIIQLVNREDLDTEYLGERLDLSEEEYRILAERLLELPQTVTVGNYCICVMACWVTSFRVKREAAFFERILSDFTKLPQYSTNNFFNQFVNTFMDFGIQLFGHECKTVEDLHELLKCHARGRQ